MSFFTELRRRNVFRVAALYAVGSWLILQVGDLLFDLMGLPGFALRIVLGILLLGFPAALVLAWIYELTPEGVKRESEIDRSTSVTAETGRKLNIAVLAAVVLALAALGLDRLIPEAPIEDTPAANPVASAPASDEDDSTPETTETRSGGASIAVLPFADLSPEGDQRYFADGLSEELLNVLAGVEGLTVASRTSSFAYRDQVKNIPVIARELKVGHILEGSVRKADNRVRITAQLIDAGSDRHLWSENFDRDLTDIFAIQDEIATAIVVALQDALGIAEPTQAISVRADTANLSAYELYLEGREAFIARDVTREVGIPALQQAVELDPKFARAWESLASAWAVSASWLGTDHEESLAASKAAAETAISLDPDLSQAYAVLGNITWEDYSVPKTEVIRLLRVALEKDPANATAHLWLGMFLGAMGFHVEGREQLARCLEAEPGYENCRRHMAYQLASAGDDAGAVALYELGVDRRFGLFEPIIVPSLVRTGNVLAAKLLMTAAWGSHSPLEVPPSRQTVLDWVRILEHPETTLSPETVARIRSEATRARELANVAGYSIHWNAALVDTGQWDLVEPFVEAFFSAWQPARADFRASPEFKALVRAIGIEEYWRTTTFPPMCRPLGEEDFECD